MLCFSVVFFSSVFTSHDFKTSLIALHSVWYNERLDGISGRRRPTLETGWCWNGDAIHVFCALHFRALISQDVAVRSQSSSRAGNIPQSSMASGTQELLGIGSLIRPNRIPLQIQPIKGGNWV